MGHLSNRGALQTPGVTTLAGPGLSQRTGGDDWAPRPRPPPRHQTRLRDPGSVGTQRARTTSPRNSCSPEPEPGLQGEDRDMRPPRRSAGDGSFLNAFVEPNGSCGILVPTQDGLRTSCGESTESVTTGPPGKSLGTGFSMRGQGFLRENGGQVRSWRATNTRGSPLHSAVTEEPPDKGLQAPGQTDTGKCGKESGEGRGRREFN